MKVLIVENADLVAQMGAEIIRELVDSKPKAVLGLATGSTPIAMYAYLVQIHKLRGLSFKRLAVSTWMSILDSKAIVLKAIGVL